MQKDARLISEVYQRILSEAPYAMPEGDYYKEPDATKRAERILSKGGGADPAGYSIGHKAGFRRGVAGSTATDAQKQDTSNALSDFVKHLIDTGVFTKKTNPADGKPYYVNPAADRNVLREILTAELKKWNAEGGSQAGYSARDLTSGDVMNMIEYTEDATGNMVFSLTPSKAPRLPSAPRAPSVPRLPKPANAPAATEAPAEPPLKKGDQFKLTGKYKVEEDIAGTSYNEIGDEDRRANAKVARSRLEKDVGRGFAATGVELINKIKPMHYSDAKQALTDLLNIGGISDTTKPEVEGDSELLDSDVEPDETPSDIANDLERDNMGGKTATPDIGI